MNDFSQCNAKHYLISLFLCIFFLIMIYLWLVMKTLYDGIIHVELFEIFAFVCLMPLYIQLLMICLII